MMFTKVPEWIKQKQQNADSGIKCTGCGKRVLAVTSTTYVLSPGAYRNKTPDKLVFCKTCMDHFRKGGPIFSKTFGD